ncbi:hypothetical protein [Lentzea tibetensis]|nr:hypothetical protein [Lentzea tibetensis]
MEVLAVSAIAVVTAAMCLLTVAPAQALPETVTVQFRSVYID